MAGGADTLSSSRLRRLAEQDRRSAEQSEEERCDLCGVSIPPDHRHVLDLSKGELLCACRACSLLFDRSAAGGGHFRLVPDRCLRLLDFELSDLTWERLRIPVEMAFFFRSTAEERVIALYPGPMGATESQLGLEAWPELEAANPVLLGLEPDVEALLVNRSRGARQQWLVPIDHCYALVGLIRTRWKGLSGGGEVWEEIGRFFDELDRRAKPLGREEQRQNASAAASAAGGS